MFLTCISVVILLILKNLKINSLTFLYSSFTYLFFYSKYIILVSPIILFYLNPKLLKKLLHKFNKIDNQPMYNNMDNLMMSYFDVKNNNKNKFKINYQLQNKQNFNNHNHINNNQQMMNNNYQMINNSQRKNINSNGNNNFLQKRHKRNVSESKKKFIASNQKWRCSHCNNLLDNTYEVDHIIALYKGGTNELNNLEALCRNCHGKKTFKEKMGLI